MSAEGTIIIDLFEGACLQYLNSSEIRLMMLYTGINTGFPPMRFDQIGTRISHPAGAVQKTVLRALLKLPLKTVEELKRYMDDEKHRFHQALSHPQRHALTKLLHLGVMTHQQNKQPATANKVQTPPEKSKAPSAPAWPAPWPKAAAKVTASPTPVASKTSSAPRRSTLERLCAALEEIGRPSHYATIHARAEQDGLTTTAAKALDLLKGSSQIVALSRTVFALACWHNRVPDAPSYVLYCPPLPISSRAPAAALLELVVFTQQWVSESQYSYRDVWEKTTKHTGLEYEGPQLFDLWYALGLCDSVDYVGQRNKLMRPAWPSGTPVTVIRQQALESLMQRMALMPQTLAALADLATPASEVLSSVVYGNAMDGADMASRVRLLEALGAISSDGSLTSLGEALHRAYPVATSAQASVSASLSSTSANEDIGWLDL